MRRFSDPPVMPISGLSPEDVYGSAFSLVGTPGQEYVERRRVPVGIAHAAGVRFDPDFAGRPAVIVPMLDREGMMTAVHGRYLHATRSQDKMLTVGVPGGSVSVLEGWRAEPLILVEGLFDALSLAVCGWASIASIGRTVKGLAEATYGRVVWAAFDAGRPGEGAVNVYMERLTDAIVRRLPPPPGCKDWNTALVKRGQGAVTRWVRQHVMQEV
jgi:hypothetical protein